MTSVRSFWASVVLLITLPMAIACHELFGTDAELLVHAGLCVGCFLLRPSDFNTPEWLKYLGTLAALVLSLTFLLQFLAPVTGIAVLHWIAYDLLGQWPEALFISLLLLWQAGVVLTASRGVLRVLGLLCVLPAIGVMLASFFLPVFGTTLYEAYPVLKIVLLLPFVWLFFESRRSTRRRSFDMTGASRSW